MAALQPAVDRIKFIITGEGRRIASPATISGFQGAIHRNLKTGEEVIKQASILSYAKVIGQKQPNGSWRVNDERASLTTNRHVRALMQALDELGISYERGPLW